MYRLRLLTSRFGRILIPKEIRKTLRIREGTELEIEIMDK
ncbi:hypothetical protein DRP05_13960 [Archaeoglobales archaeon]|nr:MAG: hypothetical protein DRP05_13960 [Archaeoglobales archaeon]